MVAQRALIVDDSKTAQIRLKKMLKRYDVVVDVAFSAEEALGYLSYSAPAVIFLDHHMKGMDGLEALKIIKANPNTAMIPVIMYTSQRGDLYVDQARALGALDILSKEVIKPSSVEQVLDRLSIYPSNTNSEATDNTDSDNKPAETINPADENITPTTPPLDPTKGPTKNKTPEIPSSTVYDSTPRAIPENDTVQIRKQVARLFEIHIADVRNQITENSKFIVRQLSGDIKRIKGQNRDADAENTDAFSAYGKANALPSKSFPNAVLSLILIALIVIGGQLYQSQKLLTAFTANSTQVRQTSRQEQLGFFSTTTAPEATASVHDRETTADTAMLLSTLSWAMNVDMSFGFARDPLGKSQVAHLQDLLHNLDQAGFRGLIKLTVHFGNFCVERTDNGDWAPANDNTLFSQCVFTQDVQPESSVDDILSIHYLQFEQDNNTIQNGDIGIILNIDEFNAPLHSYPLMGDSSVANKWNLVATKNNRISIELESE